jgi:aminopeptidase
MLSAGAHPLLMFWANMAEEFDTVLFSTASDAQLEHAPSMLVHPACEVECGVLVLCKTDPRRLESIDASRQSILARASADLSQECLERAARGKMRWVLAGLPTAGYAADAGMTLPEFEDFVYPATFADADDPASVWESVSQRQKHPVEWLVGKEHMQVKGPHIDLGFSIAGRSFINCDGHLNMPDGEIFTGGPWRTG